MDITEDEIKKKHKDGWIEAWFAIEALAISRETVESAMKTHTDGLSSARNTFVYDKKFSDIKREENPIKGVAEGFSQVVEIKLFARDVFTLVNLVILYGPSSIEILSPVEKAMKISEVQDMCNLLAGLMHQFSAAGVGGMVITPEKK